MSDGALDAGELHERLERSRAALLEALARLTEQDFASEIDVGLTVVGLLTSLAAEERAATAPPELAQVTRASLAPQAVHQLAGSRHLTMRALLGGGDLEKIAAVAEREEAAALRIRARFEESPNPS